MYSGTPKRRIANLLKEVARLRKERGRLRKEVNKLRTELKVRDLIVAMYSRQLEEADKDLEILGKINMCLNMMIAVKIDQKKKG